MEKINNFDVIYPEGSPYVKCLDRGFACLIDFMGSDARIVQAARVSYQKGTKAVQTDRHLIRYMLRGQHMTPFEKCVFEFHIKTPMFIGEQILRHRIGCLASDTELHFELPTKKNRRVFKHTILDIYNRWIGNQTITAHRKNACLDKVDMSKVYTVRELADTLGRGPNSIRGLVNAGRLASFKNENNLICIKGEEWHKYSADKKTISIPLKPAILKLNLRHCNEATGEIDTVKIKDIWESGIKPVYEITLENGYKIKMTENHRCFTDKGWLTLKDAVDLKLNKNGNAIWREGTLFATNGELAYKDKDWLLEQKNAGKSIRQMATEANISYHTIRKYLKAFEIQFTPMEKVRLSSATQKGTKRGSPKQPRSLTDAGRAAISAAQSGPNSHFWKGGTSTNRELIGSWTTSNAKKVHEKYNFTCVCCDSQRNLNAHHLDPVWNNESKAMEFDNLITLCEDCHKSIHRKYLEVDFMNYIYLGGNPKDFDIGQSKKVRPEKTQPRKPLLITKYYKPIKIEYIGEEMTYDLEVDHDKYHNFIANGFVVHNSFNKISGRYSVMKDEFYIPSPTRKQSETNRQGSSEDTVERINFQMFDGEPGSSSASDYFDVAFEDAYKSYLTLLENGVARELARSVLPASLYTEFYWTVNLRTLMNFLMLRLDPHAQYEIQVLAQAMYDLIKEHGDIPFAIEAFEDYILDKPEISKFEMDIIRQLLAKSNMSSEELLIKANSLIESHPVMSNREKKESKLISLLGLKS